MKKAFLFFISLCCLIVYASETMALDGHELTQDAPNAFNLNKAQSEFTKIQQLLKSNDLKLKPINNSINELNELITKAESCIKKSEHKINELDNQIKQYFGPETEKLSKEVDAAYLQKQKDTESKRLAACRLFKIRSEELLVSYKAALLKLQQEITFTRGDNILRQIQMIPKDWQALSSPEQKKDTHLFSLKTMLYMLPLLFLSILINWRMNRLMLGKWRNKIGLNLFNTGLIFFFLMLELIALLKPMPFIEKGDNIVFDVIISQMSYFLLALYFFRFIFRLRRTPAFLQWYGFDLKFLKQIGVVIISLYFTRAIGLNILALYEAPINYLQLFESLMLYSSLSAMLYFSWSFYRNHPQLADHIKYPFLLFQSLILITLILITLDQVGYSVLAIQSAHFIFSLMLISALGGLLLPGINKLYRVLNYTPARRAQLKKLFGYNSQPPFFELYLLRFLLQISVILSLIYMFSHMIDESGIFFDYFFDYIFVGFKIANFTMVPAQWFTGLLMFSLLVLISRRIATLVSDSQQFEEKEEETQVALASIMLYLGFSIAVIIGLLAAGFSFTSLTIIAGALSVGIGLGLQSIVNNFFSGLILLIEKPIKAGDRIFVDGVEGFVKKVSIRSTQIQTPTQEDIIVPNSDLITHQVTNFMFSDNHWRIQVEVGIAYGSNTELASKLLTDIAMSHPEVIKTGNRKPMVLFRSFGDSALIFQLWCLIRDVNRKYVVSSDLHFAIDKAFRENNISIAFPQRDVHIKWEQTKPPASDNKD